MPTDFNKQAEAYLEKFMESMRSKEAFEMITLSNGYGEVINSLQGEIDSISKLDAKSINQVYREKRFNDFLEQAESLHDDYASDSASLISTIQGQFAKAGLQTTQGLLTTLTRDFNLLPVDAINNIVGFTADGSPLDDVLLKRYGESYRDVANTLITSVAKGLNPRETAKLIGESLQGNLSDTLRIARTEQMRAYRSASLVQMEQSGVVDGWEWVTEPNACEFCKSMSGKIFSLNVNMDTHPNCRCIQAPYVKTKGDDREINSAKELKAEVEDAGLEPQAKVLNEQKEKISDEELQKQFEFVTKGSSPGYIQLLKEHPEMIPKEFEFLSKLHRQSIETKLLHAQNEAMRKRRLIFQKTGKKIGEELIAMFGLQRIYQIRTLPPELAAQVLKVTKGKDDKVFNKVLRQVRQIVKQRKLK